ncbi:MAG: hypothetical protein ACPGVP_01775, partial [Thiolinea sp.]
ITGESLSIDAANDMLEAELEPAMWAFIVRMINYPELKFDADKSVIMIDGYVPFKELAKEWVSGIADGSYDVRKCESCAAYFDVNAEEGIYGKPEEFEEYICLPCAGDMSALAYYQRFIERR